MVDRKELKVLLSEQSTLESLAIQHTAALKRARVDVTLLDELEAKAEDLRARRQDTIAEACIKATVDDTAGIDAELATVKDQIVALSDAPTTYILLDKKLANIQAQQHANQAKINQIVCAQMQAQFALAEEEFKEAKVKLNAALIKLKSALAITQLFKGNHAQLLGQYQEYAFGLYVRDLPRYDERDIAADREAAEMLEALGFEGVECGNYINCFKSEVKDEDIRCETGVE